MPRWCSAAWWSYSRLPPDLTKGPGTRHGAGFTGPQSLVTSHRFSGSQRRVKRGRLDSCVGVLVPADADGSGPEGVYALLTGLGSGLVSGFDFGAGLVSGSRSKALSAGGLPSWTRLRRR